MSQKTTAQLISDANLYLPDNTTEQVSAKDQRDRIIDLADSALNRTDGGVVTAVISYLTNLTFTDDKQLVAKKYVDDLITALKAITQGTNTLTEDTAIFNDGFSFLISSGVDEDAAQAYEVIVESAGAGLSYTDTDDPTNNVAVVLAPGLIMANGDVEITGTNKGLIMTDTDGSGQRYRITINGGSFAFEAL